MVGIERAWVGFWLVAVIWGSSFLFIRIGVEQLSTFQLVFLRTGIAAVGLSLVAYARGKRLIADAAGARDILVLGVVNTVLPFALITWGERYIASGLASVLQGTVALFTTIVAHWVFVDERLHRRKVAGLGIGFLGVLLLTSSSPSAATSTTDARLHVLGQLAVVAASFCYALGGVYGRKAIQRRLDPLVAAAGAMTVTAVISGVAAYAVPLLGGAPPTPLTDLTPRVLGAIVMLGVLNTFVAYLIFYSIIETLGAGRVSLVTYVIPAVGLWLGALVLDEPVGVRLLVGATLIVGSVAIAKREPHRVA